MEGQINSTRIGYDISLKPPSPRKRPAYATKLKLARLAFKVILL